MIDAANRAPNGGNEQRLRWIVVRDPELKQRLQRIYQPLVSRHVTASYRERAKTDDSVRRMVASVLHLAAHLHEAPVILIPCAAGTRGRVEASVYPAVQNLILAARALGLGTTLTTAHLDAEDEVKAMFGIPEAVHTFALIPVGRPMGRWALAPRRRVELSIYRDCWP